MRIGDVIAVAGIVVGELPVALVPEAVGLAHHDLAAGIAVEPLVDDRGDRAEMLGERQRVQIERAEDEAAIGFDARHLREIVLRVAHVGGIAVRPRHAAQLPGVEKVPAVIGALERLARCPCPSGTASCRDGCSGCRARGFFRSPSRTMMSGRKPMRRGDEVVVAAESRSRARDRSRCRRKCCVISASKIAGSV